MKTRFSALVHYKKNKMQKSEQVLQKANLSLSNASKALEDSYSQLGEIHHPNSGNIGKFLATRSLVSAQRDIIEYNKEWLEHEKKNLQFAKEQLKKDMIEFEKFNYLELEEIKKQKQKLKLQESKDLDEIALMSHQFKGEK